jgi:1-acyl-sn-glycerol-3-phosphate acyltransferase
MPMSSLPDRSSLPATAATPVLVLRSLAFNLAFWLWTAVMVLAAAPALLRPRQAMTRVARFWERGVLWLLARLVGLGHEVRGRERLPSGSAIYAFKHQSAWDTLMIHLLLPEAAIALKRELTLIPLFGQYLMHAGMIKIDRGHGTKALRSLIEGARAAIARGSPVVIFPEGTRVAPGAKGTYHPGVAALYTQLGLPVVPVALNSGLFWRRRGFLKRPGRAVVEFLEPIPPGLDRRAFMIELERRLEGAVAALVAEAQGRAG